MRGEIDRVSGRITQGENSQAMRVGEQEDGSVANNTSMAEAPVKHRTTIQRGICMCNVYRSKVRANDFQTGQAIGHKNSQQSSRTK